MQFGDRSRGRWTEKTENGFVAVTGPRVANAGQLVELLEREAQKSDLDQQWKKWINQTLEDSEV